MSRFLTELDVRLLTDDSAGDWQVLEPFIYQSDIAGVITVPVGFQTDFCSVPRLPFIYDLMGNTARKAGTVHDQLYTTHEVDRETADRVLREAMEADGVPHWQAQAFFLAVRMGGSSYWDKP